jgi:hypothetical protein
MFGRWRLGLQIAMGIGYGKHVTCKITEKKKMKKGEKKSLNSGTCILIFFLHKTHRVCSRVALNWFLGAFREISKSNYRLCHVRPSVWNNSTPTGWMNYREIWYFNIFLKSVEKYQGSLKDDKSPSTLHEDQHTFIIISSSFLLRMRNVSDKICRENKNTHFMF